MISGVRKIENLECWRRQRNERAAQKLEPKRAPVSDPIVRTVAAEVMALIADVADPRTAVRRHIAFMSKHPWPTPECAASAAQLIKEGGAAIHRQLVAWNFTGARREMQLLSQRLINLDESFYDYLESVLASRK